MNEIEVNVKDDGDLRFLADGGHGLENFAGRGSRGQAALGRQLVDQSVGQRIAERNAQFQNIHARAVKGQGQLAGRLQVWVPRANVNNKSRALLLQAGKPFDNAIHRRHNDQSHPAHKKGE